MERLQHRVPSKELVVKATKYSQKWIHVCGLKILVSRIYCYYMG